MRTVQSILDELIKKRYPERVAGNTANQFGTEDRPLLGARILPERRVNKNLFFEKDVTMTRPIALDTTRYSAIQRRGFGLMSADLLVSLMEQDSGFELTGDQYEIFLEYLEGNQSQEAMAEVLGLVDGTNQALMELNELHRWEAIVYAKFNQVGHGFTRQISLANPAGSRVAAGGLWSNPAYDPWPDITARKLYLATKGYGTINWMIGSERVITMLQNNPNVIKRTATVIIDQNLALAALPQPVSTREQLNGVARADSLPVFTPYDEIYRTESGTSRYIPDDCLILISTTPKKERITVEGDFLELNDTLGYYAIGIPQGQTTPGRKMLVKYQEEKPTGFYTSEWQTSFPVLTQNDCITVITGIN